MSNIYYFYSTCDCRFIPELEKRFFDKYLIFSLYAFASCSNTAILHMQLYLQTMNTNCLRLTKTPAANEVLCFNNKSFTCLPIVPLFILENLLDRNFIYDLTETPETRPLFH